MILPGLEIGARRRADASGVISPLGAAFGASAFENLPAITPRARRHASPRSSNSIMSRGAGPESSTVRAAALNAGREASKRGTRRFETMSMATRISTMKSPSTTPTRGCLPDSKVTSFMLGAPSSTRLYRRVGALNY